MANLQFRTLIRRWLPPWLTSPAPGVGAADNAYSFIYANALPLDLGMQFILEGIQAKLPGQGTPTALPLIGRDRRITRGFDEPDDAYTARLVLWRYDHQRQGNPYTTMRQLQGFLFGFDVDMRVVNAGGTWYTLLADGSRQKTPLAGNWDWDGRSSLWARYWVILYPPTELWDRDGTWGDGEVWGKNATTWGSTATREQVDTVRAIVKEWKGGHELCQGIIVSFDETAPFNPGNLTVTDGTWRYYSKNDGGPQIGAGTQVRSRDTRAIYWFSVEGIS